jgi:precorrin-8X/cobalt-precorrin-8 methylmutase
MELFNWKLSPTDIESRSFAIIDNEAGSHNWDKRSWNLVRRLVHTSADFDYVKDLIISPGALEFGIQALKDGATIFTDTNMALSGINIKRIGDFSNEIICLINDQRTIEQAKLTGLTRAMAAVDLAFSTVLKGGEKKAIWVFGNAPTALYRLLERLTGDSSLAVPSLVIGLPVGFVNALESKQALADSALPYFITNKSRKGGSNVAAAAINALAALARETA